MAIPTIFRSDQWVKTVQGNAVSGAHVYFLNQPVTTIPGTEQLGPPSPLATLYTDSTGATTVPQPLVTDSFGHCDGYMAPGIYTVAVYNNGSLSQVYADQNVGAAGAVPSSLYTAGPGISIVGSVISGAYQAGSGITIVNGVISATATGATLETNGVPNSTQALLNLAAGAGMSLVESGGTVTLTNTLNVDVVATPVGFWVASGTSANTNNAGQSGGFFLGTNSWTTSTATTAAVVPTATTPSAVNLKPNSSVANSGGTINAGSVFLTNLQSIQRLRWLLRLDQTTNMRVWMGASTQAGAGFVNDTLSTSFAGFRFSTHAGDTKYQCVTNTGSAQTTTPESTASHVDATTFHVFEIQFVSPNVLFFIDGVQVGSQSTNLPAASTLLNFELSMDNAGNVGQPACDLAWITALSNF